MKLATLKAGGRDGSPVVVTLSEEWGIDLEAEVAVVTGDVPIGASVAGAPGRSGWSCWCGSRCWTGRAPASSAQSTSRSHINEGRKG